jgi:hypothetical protein
MLGSGLQANSWRTRKNIVGLGKGNQIFKSVTLQNSSKLAMKGIEKKATPHPSTHLRP